MKQVRIGNELHNELNERVAEILCEDNFNVEIFGDIDGDCSIVDYGSRETLAIVKDGCVLDQEEMEMEDNIASMMCDVEYSYEAIKSVYYDSKLQEALETYEWDEVYERLNELMADIPAEQLRIKAKYFNMKMICMKAKVSYDTFKSWSCGRNKTMSSKKIESLLKVMKEVAQ